MVATASLEPAEPVAAAVAVPTCSKCASTSQSSSSFAAFRGGRRETSAAELRPKPKTQQPARCQAPDATERNHFHSSAGNQSSLSYLLRCALLMLCTHDCVFRLTEECNLVSQSSDFLRRAHRRIFFENILEKILGVGVLNDGGVVEVFAVQTRHALTQFRAGFGGARAESVPARDHSVNQVGLFVALADDHVEAVGAEPETFDGFLVGRAEQRLAVDLEDSHADTQATVTTDCAAAVDF